MYKGKSAVMDGPLSQTEFHPLQIAEPNTFRFTSFSFGKREHLIPGLEHELNCPYTKAHSPHHRSNRKGPIFFYQC